MTGNNESFHPCAIDLRIVLGKIRDVTGRGARDASETAASFRAQPIPPPQRTPATAMPLLMRNFFWLSDLFMNATLGRVHQIYFSNIAIFVRPHAMAFPPRSRREAVALMKQRTKRAQTGKAAFQTNCGHRDCCFLEKKFRSFHSAMIEILMRGLTERAPKNSEQMKRRQTRRGGDLRQRDWRANMRVQIIPRPIHSSPQSSRVDTRTAGRCRPRGSARAGRPALRPVTRLNFSSSQPSSICVLSLKAARKAWTFGETARSCDV